MTGAYGGKGFYVHVYPQGGSLEVGFRVVSGSVCSFTNPPYPQRTCGPINRYPPWQFESLLAQNLVPTAGVLTVGSCPGCETDSQFYEEVTSFKPTCMNTTSEVTSVVFKTGLKPACMNTTREVTSAVSVVHQLSEDISDSSSNSSGDGDFKSPQPRDMLWQWNRWMGPSRGRNFTIRVLCRVTFFRETQDPDAEWPRGLRWEMSRLFFQEKLCIPLCLQKSFIRKTHAFLGHVGEKRLWEQMLLTIEWAQDDEAPQFTMCVSRQ